MSDTPNELQPETQPQNEAQQPVLPVVPTPVPVPAPEPSPAHTPVTDAAAPTSPAGLNPKLVLVSLALNAVLLVAVGFLYYKQFAKPGGASISETVAKSPIVYIDSDSLLLNYKLYKQKMEELSTKKAQLESSFATQAQQLEAEITAYQRTQSNFSIDARIQKEKDLAARQQNLMVYRETLAEQLGNAEEQATEEVRAAITAYLKDLARKTNFQYVLGASRNSGVLYAADSLNITRAVLEGLNSAEIKRPAPKK